MCLPWLRLLCLVAILSLPGMVFGAKASQPVTVGPGGHYFSFEGRPIVLLTIDEHYGAMVNQDYDYTQFLTFLGGHGQNLTRIYPGIYIESTAVRGTPIGPEAGRQLLPWAVTDIKGAHAQLGGYKYDLDHWNEAYFTRLTDFMTKAAKHGVIVDVCFFNGMYKEFWPINATYCKNNIQGIGTVASAGVQSADVTDPALYEYQKKYVMELTRRLNAFDNLIFEIADEPWGNGTWVRGLIDAFHSVDGTAAYPKKHVLGQCAGAVPGEAAQQNANTLVNDPRYHTDWIPTEYTNPTDYCLANFYQYNRPIMGCENMEGAGYSDPNPIRADAWKDLVGGAGGHITLNMGYKIKTPTGDGGNHAKFLLQSEKLMEFMNGFSGNLPAMRKNTAFSIAPTSTDRIASSIAGNGLYVLYVFHGGVSSPHWCSASTVTSGTYAETVTLTDVPPGTYKADWIDPATLNVLQMTTVHQTATGDVVLPAPIYAIDIALRMKVISARNNARDVERVQTDR